MQNFIYNIYIYKVSQQKRKNKSGINKTATAGKSSFKISYFLTSSPSLFLPCGFIIILILSVFGPCAQWRWNANNNNKKDKQTNQLTGVVDVMVTEDKSMLMWGRGQSTHKLTETKKNENKKNEYNKQLCNNNRS